MNRNIITIALLVLVGCLGIPLLWSLAGVCVDNFLMLVALGLAAALLYILH